MGSTLFRNPIVITQNENREVLRTDVLVEGNRILETGKQLEGDSVIDADSMILMPGLLNTHTHVAMTHMRGSLDDIILSQFLEKTFKLDGERSDNGIYNSSVLGMCEMIDSGVTSFLDLYYSENIVERAVKDTGLRGFLSWVTLDREYTTQKGDPVDNARRFLGSDATTDLVDRSVGVQGVYVAGEETYLRAQELARAEDTIVHTHLSETREEVYNHLKKTGKRPVEYLDSIGFLDSNVIAAHSSWVTLNEMRILSRKGVKVSWNPVSNAKLATGGICPVPEMLGENVTVSIGTDSSGSNNSLNVLESMKYGAITIKNSRWDASILNAQKILDFATIDAAQSLRRSDLGSVQAGKTADLVLIDCSKPNLIGTDESTAVSNVVYSANPSNVHTVMVNGRILKSDHRLLKSFDDFRKGDSLR
ncbi:MAG: amidohydrolase family protein [Thermoplasmataceae archaeon]